MPKLWNTTIAAHRQAVRDTVLDTTAALVAEHGLGAVTMSQIAEAAGIGRATLYKYFPSVEAVLLAWHERQVQHHLAQLTALDSRGGEPGVRLAAVFETYAGILHEHHGTELAALLHQGEHVAHARQHLRDFIEHLLREGVAHGVVRDDVPPNELAHYCLHALTAATSLSGPDAVHRLAAVTLAGVRALT